MPFLVLRGGKSTVKKPDGMIVRHAFKTDTVFLENEKVVEGRAFEFEKDGYHLIVDTEDVKTIVFT